MDIQKISIDQLKAARYNPRMGLKPGDAEFEKLKRSIEEFGFVELIVVNKRTGFTVISGHQRLAVLKYLKWTEVECVLVDLDEASEKALNIVMNKVSGEWDMPLLTDLLKDLEDSGFDVSLTGFETADLDDPFDAVYFTQRICGICSTAHSVASTLVLEDALIIIPSEQGRYLRDFIHGCEFLQNHLRHFYQYTIPDYVKLPQSYPLYDNDQHDYRLPKAKNDLMVKHYFEALIMSRNAHEMLAVLGGKAPHNHGVFLGGITTQATTDKIMKIKSILNSIDGFINYKMIPDVYMIAEYYQDYFHNGRGYGNLLSFGCFNAYKDLGTLYVNPLLYTEGTIYPFNADGITEEIDYSWYSDKQKNLNPWKRYRKQR